MPIKAKRVIWVPLNGMRWRCWPSKAANIGTTCSRIWGRRLGASQPRLAEGVPTGGLNVLLFLAAAHLGQLACRSDQQLGGWASYQMVLQ